MRADSPSRDECWCRCPFELVTRSFFPSSSSPSSTACWSTLRPDGECRVYVCCDCGCSGTGSGSGSLGSGSGSAPGTGTGSGSAPGTGTGSGSGSQGSGGSGTGTGSAGTGSGSPGAVVAVGRRVPVVAPPEMAPPAPGLREAGLVQAEATVRAGQRRGVAPVQVRAPVADLAGPVVPARRAAAGPAPDRGAVEAAHRVVAARAARVLAAVPAGAVRVRRWSPGGSGNDGGSGATGGSDPGGGSAGSGGSGVGGGSGSGSQGSGSHGSGSGSGSGGSGL